MILRDARSGVWLRRKVKVMNVEIKKEGDPTPQSLRAEMTVLMCGDMEVAEAQVIAWGATSRAPRPALGKRCGCHWLMWRLCAVQRGRKRGHCRCVVFVGQREVSGDGQGGVGLLPRGRSVLGQCVGTGYSGARAPLPDSVFPHYVRAVW